MHRSSLSLGCLLVLVLAHGCLAIADFSDEHLHDVAPATDADGAVTDLLLGDRGDLGDDTIDQSVDLARDITPPDLLSPDTRPWCQSGGCNNPSPVCELTSGLCRKCFDHKECAKEGKGAICDQSQANICRACQGAADCAKANLPPICDNGKCTMSCTTAQDCQNANLGDQCSSNNTCEMCQTHAQCQLWLASWLICDKTGAVNKCRGCKQHKECQDQKKLTFCDIPTAVCRNTCETNQECVAAGQDPFCDTATKKCRGCVEHAECGSAGYCNLGKCSTASTGISYVKCTSGCSGGGNGTMGSPFCRLEDADLAPPKTIAVLKSTSSCAGRKFTNDAIVYGEPGATIDGFVDFDAVSGELHGLIITGTVKFKDKSGKVIGCTVGPSTGVGITATGSPDLFIGRNLIWKNADGGMSIDVPKYTVVNNFIVQNGSAVPDFGVKLKGGGSFANNTVSENTSKADKSEKVAIRCEGTINIHNNLVWGNKPQGNSKNQIDPTCVPFNCDVEGLSPLVNGSINQDPNFKGTGLGADPWHILSGSPCNGKADPSKAPPVDYDGQLRSTSAPDIGADEI